MTVEAAIFRCSICGEPSHEICVYCTKDACSNHRCERCKRCSDCCECEVPLSAGETSPEPEQAATLAQPDIETAAQPAADVVPPPEPLEDTPTHESPGP